MTKIKKVEPNNNHINIIAVAGYGEFGSQFVLWIENKEENIKILYIIEPDKTKINHLKRKGYRVYDNVLRVAKKDLENTDVIVDCSTKNQGENNIKLYKSLNIPGIFQNGEAINIGYLFYSPLYKEKTAPRYMKIARCSAMSTTNVLLTLIQSNINIKRVHAYHYKVNNRDKMLDMDYLSGKEINLLLGIDARVDVMYLRGKTPNGYAYHGNLQIESDRSISLEKLMNSFSNSKYVNLVNQTIDTLNCERTSKTLVIKESIVIYNNILNLVVLSFTPEINFPENVKAIKILSTKG